MNFVRSVFVCYFELLFYLVGPTKPENWTRERFQAESVLQSLHALRIVNQWAHIKRTGEIFKAAALVYRSDASIRWCQHSIVFSCHSRDFAITSGRFHKSKSLHQSVEVCLVKQISRLHGKVFNFLKKYTSLLCTKFYRYG